MFWQCFVNHCSNVLANKQHLFLLLCYLPLFCDKFDFQPCTCMCVCLCVCTSGRGMMCTGNCFSIKILFAQFLETIFSTPASFTFLIGKQYYLTWTWLPTTDAVVSKTSMFSNTKNYFLHSPHQLTNLWKLVMVPNCPQVVPLPHLSFHRYSQTRLSLYLDDI